MTAFWWIPKPGIYRAGERALADIGFALDKDRYLRDMTQSGARGPRPGRRASTNRPSAGNAKVRNEYYQEYLRTEAIDIEAVVETLADLSKYVAWRS